MRLLSGLDTTKKIEALSLTIAVVKCNRIYGIDAATKLFLVRQFGFYIYLEYMGFVKYIFEKKTKKQTTKNKITRSLVSRNCSHLFFIQIEITSNVGYRCHARNDSVNRSIVIDSIINGFYYLVPK